MTLEIELKDIDGRDIHIGSRVMAYAQEFEILEQKGNVYVVDSSRPKPIRDVPLFIGTVGWCQEFLSLRIAVEELIAPWETNPSAINMGGGSYVYQLI